MTSSIPVVISKQICKSLKRNCNIFYQIEYNFHKYDVTQYEIVL